MISGSIIRMPKALFGPKNHFGLVTSLEKGKTFKQELISVHFEDKEGLLPKENQVEIGRLIFNKKYSTISSKFQRLELILYKSGYENDLRASTGRYIDIKISDVDYTNIEIKKMAFDRMCKYYYEYIY